MAALAPPEAERDGPVTTERIADLVGGTLPEDVAALTRVPCARHAR